MHTRYKKIAMSVSVLLFFVSTAAFAHHPMQGEMPTSYIQGLLSGLAHPIIGADHLAFVIGVGIVFGLGVTRPIISSTAMLIALAVGTLLSWYGIILPFIETIVALTVIAIAATVVFKLQIMGFVTWAIAAAAFCHGQAFGVAIIGAEPTPLVTYLIGLSIVQIAMASIIYYLTKKIAARSATQLRILTAGGGVALGIAGVLFMTLSV
jgi:urease accessory protein